MLATAVTATDLPPTGLALPQPCLLILFACTSLRHTLPASRTTSATYRDLHRNGSAGDPPCPSLSRSSDPPQPTPASHPAQPLPSASRSRAERPLLTLTATAPAPDAPAMLQGSPHRLALQCAMARAEYRTVSWQRKQARSRKAHDLNRCFLQICIAKQAIQAACHRFRVARNLFQPSRYCSALAHNV